MTDGLVKMMSSPDDFTGPVNIGNPREYSILELAQKILEKTGSKSKIVYKPLPQDDPLKRRPDITLAKKRLGWEPASDLTEGLNRTIEYFQSVGNN
jgi:UDP-glucuronate decarboxylase